MKKLMLATLAAAAVGGAFAEPLVYDYKASVKHLYLKDVHVKIKDKFDGWVYQKYQTTSALQGYLIMDADGVTSPTINAANAKYFDSVGFDYGRNRGFLVVRNNSLKGDDKAYKTAKILPAVLDAKWIDTAFTKNPFTSGHGANSGLAEGTLFVGGDAIRPVRQQLDEILVNNKLVVKPRKDADNNNTMPALVLDGPEFSWSDPAIQGSTPGMVAVSDYVWTSIYLFGEKNGPNWFPNLLGYSPFGMFEYAWDFYLPYGLKTGWQQFTEEGIAIGYRKAVNNYFHDTWMNGAGVGKWTKPNDKDVGKRCCGLKPSTIKFTRILDTLSGNLKGGLFLCTENGIWADPPDDRYYYQWFDGYAWEDQFNSPRLEDGSGLFGGDVWQNDLWQDGFLDQATTDVIYGTWSIKYNSKVMKDGGKFDLKGDLAFTPSMVVKGAKYPDEAVPGSTVINDKALWVALWGAAYDLDKKVNFYNGREIYNYTDDERAEVPMITPQFAYYYRLIYQVPIN